MWDWDRPGNIKRDITILNRFRRENPALHELTNLRFLDCPDPNTLVYAKATADRSNIVIVVVNLDPHGVHGGEITLPLHEWNIAPDQEFSVEEAFTEASIRGAAIAGTLCSIRRSNPRCCFACFPQCLMICTDHHQIARIGPLNRRSRASARA